MGKDEIKSIEELMFGQEYVNKKEKEKIEKEKIEKEKRNITQTKIILNILKLENKTYLSVDSLKKYTAYLSSELEERKIKDNYCFWPHYNIDTIERFVLWDNDILKIDIDRDYIYLRDKNSLDQLIEKKPLDKEIIKIIESKVKNNTKREEVFKKACDMTGIKIHEATLEEIKQGLFIKCDDEIIKLTIDNNGNYIIGSQDEFTMQKKMVNEPNNVLRKRYRIIGRKQNKK